MLSDGKSILIPKFSRSRAFVIDLMIEVKSYHRKNCSKNTYTVTQQDLASLSKFCHLRLSFENS